MKHLLVRIILVLVCFSIFSPFIGSVCFADTECDEPEDPEETRIYFLNGMRNSSEKAMLNVQQLENDMGIGPIDIGLSYNDMEFWILELLEVYLDRQNETYDFWEWLNDMSSAPQWFQDDYTSIAGRFMDDQVYNDTDLLDMVDDYKRDLKSGKKVVLVAHSQGNFYANNAYRYFLINYPQYINSIGLVSVATPADKVQDNGPYTTNPSDNIINFVRSLYPDTLAGNVTSSDHSALNHGFVDTYLAFYKSRIVGHVNQQIAALDTPEKAFECSTPDEVPVAVLTNYANPQDKTATLHGYVQSGKSIAGHFLYQKAKYGDLPTCWEWSDFIPTSGTLNMYDDFSGITGKLTPGTDYKFRACGREGDRISNGGVVTFTTADDVIVCDSSIDANGSSEGLNIVYGMGNTGGDVLIKFNAYTIPDSLTIKQGSTVLYDSGGLISSYHEISIYHNPVLGTDWEVKVVGNVDEGTIWNLYISCPQ